MRIFTEAVVKFNGGKGALLCNHCGVIIDTGFDHEDVKHCCAGCFRNGLYEKKCTFPACKCDVPDYAFSAHNRKEFCNAVRN